MAKIGEGDQRWIVKERSDGANCNAWHWEERTISTQTHDAIKELFKGLVLANGNDNLDIKIKEVSDISGDVCVSQRKSKIMSYWELNMTLKYEGKCGDDDVSGKITIPDVDHDTFRDSDYAMSVSAADKGTSQTKAERYVHESGRKAVRKSIQDFFEKLYVDYNVGKMIKGGIIQDPNTGSKSSSSSSSTTSAASASPSSPAKSSSSIPSVSQKPAASTSSSSSSSSSGEPTKFNMVMIWRVPPAELFTILTDAPRASAYTRAPAKIDARPTGTFEFMGGAITGYYVELQHPNKMTMQWRLSSWPSGVFSTVVIDMTQEEVGVTRMEFAQAGIPAGEVDRVKSGWMCNFFDPIKIIFGFQYEIK